MSRRAATSALVGIFTLLIALAIFVVRPPTPPPVAVTFVGITNSPSNARLAEFRIFNRSVLQVARNGYCRLDGEIVDIPPTRILAAGASEIVRVPFSKHRDDAVRDVRFNGVRDFQSFESIIDRLIVWLGAVGIKLDVLDMSERRRWEVKVEFRDHLHSTAGGSDRTQMTREAETDSRK